MKLKDSFLNFVRGVIMGIANIIPGVSGGTLAVSLGLYELIINSISTLFKSFKKNILILLPIILGMLVGVLSSSKLVSFCLDKYFVQTILFFIGLVLGGTKIITKKVKGKIKPSNILVFAIVFIFMIVLNLVLPHGKDVSFQSLNLFSCIKLFLIGIIASGTMIIPGVSGSLVLMILGYYKPIINVISDLTNFGHLGHNMLILIPFGVGIVVGIFLIAKLINYLLNKYQDKTYFGIIGFVISSVFILIFQIHSLNFSVLSLISYVVFLAWGYLLAINIDKE